MGAVHWDARVVDAIFLKGESNNNTISRVEDGVMVEDGAIVFVEGDVLHAEEDCFPIPLDLLILT